MRDSPAWRICYGLVPGCALAAFLATSCNPGGGCGDGVTGASSSPCPPGASAFARVVGQALSADDSPIARKIVHLSCSDRAFAEDRTNAEGRFEILAPYSVGDTTLYPYPPRAEDGSFELSCRLVLPLSSSVAIVQDLPVRFAPSMDGVVPTTIELRESAP